MNVSIAPHSYSRAPYCAHTHPALLGGIACPKILFRSLLSSPFNLSTSPRKKKYTFRNKCFAVAFSKQTPFCSILTVGALLLGVVTSDTQFECAGIELVAMASSKVCASAY